MSASLPTPIHPTHLHQSILQYLTQLQQAGSEAAKAAGIVDVEPLEIAIQCLTEATGVSLTASDSLVDGGLMEIYSKGVDSIRSIQAQPNYSQFIHNLQEKTDFFKGVNKESFEYTKRMEQARNKFAAKFGESSSSHTPSTETSTDTPPVSKEDQQKAEAAKNEGNALLGKGDHAGAVQKYSDAIRFNPQNAIYYANRAAAHVNLRDFKSAVADCQSSIKLDPEYPKSHYRLGQGYVGLGQHSEALEAFEAALARCGKDEGMAVTIREQIRLTKQKLNPSPSAGGGAGAGAGGNPFGGMDFASLLNNPALSGLMNSPEIAGMMSNPAMMDMMKNFDFGSMMNDPSMAGLMGKGGLDGAARAAAGNRNESVDTSYKPPSADSLFDDEPTPAAAAATAPKPSSSSSTGSGASSSSGGMNSQLANFLNTPAGQAAANDPDLKPVLQDIQANGMGAAMKHMSNPKVMSKISALMGPLMGGGKK